MGTRQGGMATRGTGLGAVGIRCRVGPPSIEENGLPMMPSREQALGQGEGFGERQKGDLAGIGQEWGLGPRGQLGRRKRVERH